MNTVLKRYLVLLFIFPLAAYAQRNSMENLKVEDLKTIKWGFSIGFNQMDFDIMPADNFNNLDTVYSIENTRKVGFSLGPLVSLRLNQYMDLRAFFILSFGQRNLAYTIAQKTTNGKPPYTTKEMIIESTFAELPIQLKFNGKRYTNVRPYIIVGGNLKYDWAAQKKIKEEELPKIRLKPYDIYYEAGFGLEYYFPYFKLSSEIKFAFGVANILQRDDTQYTSSIKTLNSKMVVVLFHFQ